MRYANGDGWEIHFGDSRVIIPDLLSPDDSVHFMTDPPYGIGLAYGEDPDNWRPGWEFWKLLYDRCSPLSTLHMTVSNKHLAEWLRDVTEAGWLYQHTSVYWNRRRAGGNANGQFAYAWEPLLSFSKMPSMQLAKRMLSDVFPHNGKRDTEHPAERDLGVWRLFMSLLPDGLVVDPFLGSGTTLRAAIDLGRPAIGIEAQEQWCHQASLRCSQMSLFAGDLSKATQASLPLEEGTEH